MIDVLAYLPLLAPLALVAVGLVARRATVPTVLATSRAATLLTIALAAVTGVRVALLGASTSRLGPGFALRLDALGAVMFALVAVLGAAVVQFSRRYLAGDPRHGRFVGDLCTTVGAVVVLVLSGDLVQLAAAWVATSYALHRLLLFYPERRSAVVAGRKKFLVARAGDVCLAAAVLLVARAFGTTDIADVLARARVVREAPPGIEAAAVLLCASAMLKSAQFPTHGWLAEVMETPTPVSALLHAGILNGGTFLVVRLADVVLLGKTALALLVVVGGLTAMFASVVMVTQPSVKVALAYSSAAHMGFMLLLCGMGAFSVAILHLVAHSFYKAHAFLSSGSVVDAARASRETRAPRIVSPARALLAFVLAAGVYVTVGLALGVHLAEKPGVVALGLMLVLALTHLVAQGVADAARAPVVGRVLLASAATAFAFFALEMLASRVLAGAVPVAPAPEAVTVALVGLVLVGFAVVTALQLLLVATPKSPFWRAVWVHVRNGFYANALFDRVVGALRT